MTARPASDLSAYRRKRLDRLDDLLEDPESWRHIAAQALAMRSQTQRGTEPYRVLSQLHRAAVALVAMADAHVAPRVSDTCAAMTSKEEQP